jgi:hypothetical protein
VKEGHPSRLTVQRNDDSMNQPNFPDKWHWMALQNGDFSDSDELSL